MAEQMRFTIAWRGPSGHWTEVKSGLKYAEAQHYLDDCKRDQPDKIWGIQVYCY